MVLLWLALPLIAQSEPKYVGSQACAKCHLALARQWSASGHAKIFQPATPHNVEGNFAAGKATLGGSTYLLQRRADRFYIGIPTESGGVLQRIDYTLGFRHFQEYLTTLPDGLIVVVPAVWDNLRKQWVHESDVDNPEAAPSDAAQIWNKSCASCHVSRVEKNFDLAQLRYNTRWQEFGVDCESCHGPGGEHVAKAAGVKVLDKTTRALIRESIVNPARLDAARSTMVCAPCHSFSDTYAAGYRPGEDYYDFFTPVMQYRLPADDSAYWADGRPRWMSNEVFGLWQSQCFLKGRATCATCHTNPHSANVAANPQLGANSNAPCAKCHKSIAANVSAHTHHSATSAGSLCVNCHMPPSVVSLNTRMRDHSMSIPVPENTTRHGVPNACNLCHQDRGVEWAVRQLNAWYRDKSRQPLIARADAFAPARKGDASAVSALLAILNDSSAAPLVRANAAGFLGNFPNEAAAYDAVLRAFGDADPLVRQTAASAIRPRAAQREAVAPALVALLRDPVRTVRMSAAIALVALGVREVPDDDRRPFEQAKADYAARAALNRDSAQQQFAAGQFFQLAGNAGDAITAFRAALKLDPSIPAQYYLAAALADKGDYTAAREQITSLAPNDRQYEAAQRLLAQIERKQSGTAPGTAVHSDAAQKRFLDAQIQFQNGYYGPALQQFEDALRQSPRGAWAIKAQIYRAICLEKLARTQDAEAAMQSLADNPEARRDVDFQLAYAELLSDTGRDSDALKRVDDLIAAVPNAPMAYFWRAKLLLQLGRTDEAAKAAEESVRLQPDLPVSHNLLLKLYQAQGRTAEAAKQAEWLRDYQRRLQSR